MVAKVKLTALDASNHVDDDAVAVVGESIRITVSITDRRKSVGGAFTVAHPALGAPVRCEFPGRYESGDDKRTLRKRKDRPTNYEGADSFRFTIPVTAVGDAAALTLTAAQDCAIEAPDDPTPLRAVADNSALSDLLPVLVVDALSHRHNVSRAGNQGVAQGSSNVVQARVQFHAQLFFLDPEGNERALPSGVPIVAELGHTARRDFAARVHTDGKVSLTAIASSAVLTHHFITLRLGDTSGKVVLCELPGAQDKSESWAALPPETDPTGTRDKRFFELPKGATLRELALDVSNDGGRWEAGRARFALAAEGRPKSLGKVDAPVKIVIKPKWQFMRFEFFDRMYGKSDHGGKAVAMPAVTLEGFADIPTRDDAEPDTRSNWWIDPSSDGKVVQCLPWLRQRSRHGRDRPKPDEQTEVRFSLPAKACVHSESKTKRTRVIATDEQLAPGPDRLKFYDLPSRWRARNYIGWLSDTAGEFGWYQDIAKKDTAAGKPMVFSLDDIVLTDASGKMLDGWTNDDRLAVFAHTFDDSLGDCTKEGLYKADAGDKKSWLTQKPASGAPEESWNYVRDLPKWTRLILAGGNLFDVFDVRSVAGSALGADETVGARAAVRWIDATGPLPPMETWQKNATPPPAWTKVVNGKPSAGMLLHPTRPARSDHRTLSIQPFYDQEYVTRQGVYKPSDPGGSTGRCDLALVRCCGVADRDTVGSEKEIAFQLYLIKQHLDFVDAPTAGEAPFKETAHRALLDAWNGVTPAHGRPTLLPTDTTKRVKVTVLTLHAFMDTVDGAHFTLTVKTGLQARNNRGGQLGTGLLADGKHVDRGGVYGFTNAHEHGHERALPDEYNESADCASFWQLSFGQHLPGDPYYLCGATLPKGKAKPMMNGNGPIHPRYFWQSAEWVHRALGFSFKISYNGFDDYRVPTHTNARRNHVFWPIVGGNDKTLPAVSPIASNRAKFHYFLYPLGKDPYSLADLPALEDPAGSTPYDGILILPVLIKVTPPVGDRSSLEQLSKALANAPRRFGDRKLNHRWYMTGSASATGGETWTFARCLLHFSPRLLVAAEDLPTRAAFLALESAVFAGESVATAFAGMLDTYHAVPWAPLLAKQNAITAVRVAVPEPTLDVRGDWDTASAQIPTPPPPTDGSGDDSAPPPPLRPAKFTALDTLLSQYEGIAADQLDARVAKLVEIVLGARDAAKADLTSPYRPAARALDQRSFSKYKCVLALKHIAAIQKRAATLEADHTAHTKKVADLEALHGVHFEVVCELGAAKPAAWKITSPIEEPPKPDPFLEGLADEIRTDARVQTAVARLRTYHAAAVEDYAARLAALDALKTPATASPVNPRGDWDTSSQVSGQRRPRGFSSVDSGLSNIESLGDDDHGARATALQQVTRYLEGVLRSRRHGAFKPAAQALKGRVDLARREALAMSALRELEALAGRRKDALQLESASRHVTLTAPSADAFEAALLEVLPSMYGAYKPAEAITADDLKPIVDALGITSPTIVAI